MPTRQTPVTKRVTIHITGDTHKPYISTVHEPKAANMPRAPDQPGANERTDDETEEIHGHDQAYDGPGIAFYRRAQGQQGAQQAAAEQQDGDADQQAGDGD